MVLVTIHCVKTLAKMIMYMAIKTILFLINCSVVFFEMLTIILYNEIITLSLSLVYKFSFNKSSISKRFVKEFN